MKLFLSRLVLNPRSRQVWSELEQPYEMHKTMMRAFPKATDEAKAKARDEFGVLFRADAVDTHSDVMVYVQSLVQPNWSSLEGLEDYLGIGPPNPECREVSAAYGNLRKGQVLAFRLRANPTKRVGQSSEGDPGRKGKRVGLFNYQEQIDWLIRKGREIEKGKPGGFEILAKDITDQSGEVRQIPRVNIISEGTHTGHKRVGANSHDMTHLSVRFDGLLRVTEPEAFFETLAAGIGSAKAYGFGLLSIGSAKRGPT